MAGILTALPLHASDVKEKFPRPPVNSAEPQDSSGFYIGTQTGGLSRSGAQSFSNSNGGVIFQSIYGGYNWQLGRWILGIEGDLGTFGKPSDLLGVRGRFGYEAGPVLFYATAGEAFESFHSGVLGAFVGGNGGAGGNGAAGANGDPGGNGGGGGNGFSSLLRTRSTLESRVGFFAGGGAEVKLSPLVGLGVEALYYSFDRDPSVGTSRRGVVAINGRLTYYLGSSSTRIADLATSWAGFYGGGHVGAAYNLSGSVINSAVLTNGQNGDNGTRGTDGGGGGGGAVAFASFQRYASVMGGLHAGYNRQSGNVVFGGEGGIDLGSTDVHKYLGSLRGRLGWACGPFLLYGTGGVALNYNRSIRSVFAGNGRSGGNGGATIVGPGGLGGIGGLAVSHRANEARVGLVVGFGLETKISNQISLGVESVYYGFGRRTQLPVIPTVSGGRTFVSSSTDNSVVVQTRLSFSLQP
jgi:hypothetical protein